jgi:hypothetical protein
VFSALYLSRHRVAARRQRLPCTRIVRTPFAAIAEAFEKLEATTFGLQTIDILADLLASFDNEDHKYELPLFFPAWRRTPA